jgi:glycosyltransferase involved in cell wall biosynthesis
MRIVQALGSSGRGGAERFFTRLAKALHVRNVPQAIITRRKAWAAEQLEEAGVPFSTAWFGGKFDIITRAKYRRVLTALHANVAINWMPHAAISCPQGPWVKVARLGKSYPSGAFSGCDHLIAATPRIAREMEERGWPAGRLSVIPNFVPENRVAPARRAAFNTPEDAPLIVWLGRMEREKGPDIAVRTIAKLPKAYLWMAGAGAYEETVKELAAQMGVTPRIRFLGWRDDGHALLKTADLFLRTSRSEGSGYVLEAFANGVPVVSAHSMDAGHLVTDGQNGLLAPKDNPAALAQALQSLIENRDLAARLGASGKAVFQAQYSEEPVIGMYLDLCQRLKDDYAARTQALLGAGGAATTTPAPA